jgi:hypothetical protein
MSLATSPLSDRAALLALLNAPSKQAVDEFLCGCARDLDGPQIAAPTSQITELATTFSTSVEDAKRLQRTGMALVSAAVYADGVTKDDGMPLVLQTLLGDDFHADLGALLGRVVLKRVGEWRAASLVAGGVSTMPRLEEAKWQVYRKPAAPSPSMLLSLTLSASAGDVDASGGGRKVNVEMSKEQLEAMLQSLSKVKEQLDNV